MKIEKYFVYDGNGGDHDFCDTIEKARKSAMELIQEDGMYIEDPSEVIIMQVVETIGHKVTDSKSNYKYESEDEAIEANDDEAIENEDFWPHDIDYEEIWDIKFIKQ